MEENLDKKEEFAKAVEQASKYREYHNKIFSEGRLPGWNSYVATQRFKSVRRAIRRGHVDLLSGVIFPKRPFNNSKSTKGNRNELKKTAYAAIHQRAIQ